MVSQTPSRATLRRRRNADPLASRTAVREVLAALRAKLPKIVPAGERDQIALLRAARHADRRASTDTKRGRPSRWRRDDLLRVTGVLGPLVERASGGRAVSTATFVDHYLRIIHFPADVAEPLERGEINVFEAEHLARLTPQRLAVAPSEAKSVRREVLKAHLLTHGSGERLRRRVNSLLAEASGAGEKLPPAGEYTDEILEATDELEAELRAVENQASDARHLFYEHLLAVLRVLADVGPEAFERLSDAERDRLFDHGDKIILTLQRLGRGA